MKTKCLLAAGLLSLSSAAYSIPTLQLDIDGGTYDSTSQTIITSNQTFDLYAYATPGSVSADVIKLTDYFVSMAVTGPDGNSIPSTPANLGSFQFSTDGGGTYTTVNVTSDMIYGTAPVDAMFQNWDAGDLPKHGIFPTYFYQLALAAFTDSLTKEAYNTADRAINGDPIPDDSGSTMFYQKILLDTTNLAAGYDLHFDLYSRAIIDCSKNSTTCTDIDVDDFAPFSHDAESTRDGVPPPPPPQGFVPEPSIMALLGLGTIGLGLMGRRKKTISL